MKEKIFEIIKKHYIIFAIMCTLLMTILACFGVEIDAIFTILNI